MTKNKDDDIAFSKDVNEWYERIEKETQKLIAARQARLAEQEYDLPDVMKGSIWDPEEIENMRKTEQLKKEREQAKKEKKDSPSLSIG